jgi:Uma2 family endonuclease
MNEPDLRRPASYADIEALPEHLLGEIIGGELLVSPKPAGPHVLAASTLAGILLNTHQRAQGGPGGWWILSEPELHLGRNVLVPDIAGWRREKMPRVPQTHAFEIAPDWVCEVISPATRKIDRRKKPPVYHRAKAGHLWLLEPLNRTLEIFRWSEAGWVLAESFSDDDKVKAEPFEAAEIDLLELWGEERPAGEPTGG